MNPDDRSLFSIVKGPDIVRLIEEDLEGVVKTVKAGYLAHAGGLTVNPPSVFLRMPEPPNARIIALPAHLVEPWPISGVKWIASYPDNLAKGLPRASAVLLLNNTVDGRPFACMEASAISAARTAASAVLAAEHLVPAFRQVRTLAIIGAGFIAHSVYRMMLGLGWSIERICVHDIDTEHAERFVQESCLPQRHAAISIETDAGTAIRAADLVLFATVAAKPYLHDAGLFDHHPVVLHLSLRDLDPNIILGACNIVDDLEHVMQAQTSLHLAEQLTGSRDFVTGTITDLLEGHCALIPDRTRIFSPFGLGLLDVAVGKWIFDRAVASGVAVEIPGFF